MLFLSHHLKEKGFKIGKNGVLKEFGGLGRNLGHNYKHGTEKEDGIGKTWTEFGPNHLTALAKGEDTCSIQHPVKPR